MTPPPSILTFCVFPRVSSLLHLDLIQTGDETTTPLLGLPAAQLFGTVATVTHLECCDSALDNKLYSANWGACIFSLIVNEVDLPSRHVPTCAHSPSSIFFFLHSYFLWFCLRACNCAKFIHMENLPDCNRSEVIIMRIFFPPSYAKVGNDLFLPHI